MCGINGFNWSDEALVRKMNQAIKHRGPDDEGTYVDGAVSLGHVRLSIIDLSEKGHQPMSDRNKNFYVIYNGEIYNFEAIREELESLGYTFNSQTDTEVLLYSFIEWGERCLERFNGMFAFAIYDLMNKKMFLARDRVGIKPLYYFYNGEQFIFSSEIPAILIHKSDTKPNKKLIRDLLLYNTTDHTNETFFADIYKIPKGHYAVFDLETRKLELKEWWRIKFEDRYDGTYSQAVDALEQLLTDSVNLRLVSDVPVGTCLSGGIDSSSIACLINDAKRTEIKTFSVVFPGFSQDESKYIDLVVNETNMINFKVNPSAAGMRKDLETFISAMGEPVASTSPYSQYCVQRLAKEHGVTVLLDGQGADELFAGYHYFFGFHFRYLLRSLKISTFLKEFKYLLSGGQYELGILSLLFLLTPLSLRHYYFTRKSNVSKELLEDISATTNFFEDYYKCESLFKALEYHINYKLEHLLKWEDRNSMAHSREARVPFLDYRIMEFVSGLPQSFILHGGRTKAILRDAMKGIAPEEILNRVDKIGFATPEDEWLRTKEFEKLLNNWFLQGTPRSYPFINLQRTRRYIKEHLYKGKSHGRILWKTLFLECWLKKYFEDKVE